MGILVEGIPILIHLLVISVFQLNVPVPFLRKRTPMAVWTGR
jgi:hypothetical protein